MRRAVQRERVPGGIRESSSQAVTAAVTCTLTDESQMKAYARDPLNAYILVRIFHVEGAPRMRFFVDPWNHPGLRWGPLGDDGYYPVWTI
jgi:hypothetical protein